MYVSTVYKYKYIHITYVYSIYIHIVNIMLMQARYVGRHGGTSVSYPGALAQATNDRIAKEKGAALWHWVTADPYENTLSSRTSKSRSTTISVPNLRLSGVRSTLGRTVVLQPTAQELLPHNLQPNLALQSLTGG